MASDTFPLRVGPRKTVLARTYRDLTLCPIFNDPEVDTRSRVTPIDDYQGYLISKVKTFGSRLSQASKECDAYNLRIILIYKNLTR